MDECRARYGEVVRVDQDTENPNYPKYIFHKGELEIAVRFVDDKSVQEVFSHIDGTPLTGSEFDAVLDANVHHRKIDVDWENGHGPDGRPTLTVHCEWFKIRDKPAEGL